LNLKFGCLILFVICDLIIDALLKSEFKKIKMNTFTIITAILVIGIVWGGLTFFLSRALKYENIKMKNGEK
jgi:hypothetical protein